MVIVASSHAHPTPNSYVVPHGGHGPLNPHPIPMHVMGTAHVSHVTATQPAVTGDGVYTTGGDPSGWTIGGGHVTVSVNGHPVPSGWAPHTVVCA